MAVNISKVYLMDVPLEDDMRNTLYFANASAQQTYFQSKIAKSYLNVSYQSDTRTFRCPDQLDTVRQYNYIMWQNPAYSNKWFYAFIKKAVFVSPGYTDIEFEVDPLQTFMFDITVKASFIEREHCNDDTVGNNLIPEGLELGEYVSNGTVTTMGVGGNLMYVINADKAPSTGSNPDTSTYYSTNTGGLPMSGGLFLFANMATFTNAMLTYSRMTGGLDHIKSAYVINGTFTLDGYEEDYVDGTYDEDEYAYYKYTGKSTPKEYSVTLSAPTTIDGYTPRNKKLLSAPYQYLLMTNNNGASNTLNYEFFNNRATITVKSKGVPTVGCSIYAYPTNYKGITDNYNEGIIGGKYPTLSWSGDAYTNWLTQNAVNIGTNIFTNALGIGASAVAGAMTGGVGSVIGLTAGINSVDAVTKQLTELYNHSIVPNTFSGNTNGGDVITSSKTNGIYLWKMSITSQFASIIDSYFDVYGYKVNKVKVPNTNHRQNWWYTKTIGANIVGNVPNDEMNKIKKAYDDGITYWKDPTKFLDYSQSNGIV